MLTCFLLHVAAARSIISVKKYARSHVMHPSGRRSPEPNYPKCTASLCCRSRQTSFHFKHFTLHLIEKKKKQNTADLLQQERGRTGGLNRLRSLRVSSDRRSAARRFINSIQTLHQFNATPFKPVAPVVMVMQRPGRAGLMRRGKPRRAESARL